MKELLQEINGPSFDASRAAVDKQDIEDYEQSVIGEDDAADKKNGHDASEDKPGPSGDEPLKHYREGKPGDGIVYEDDWGYKCKIDKVGRPYKIGEDGRRALRPSLRPKNITPEDWQKLPLVERERLKRMEQDAKDERAAEEKIAKENYEQPRERPNRKKRNWKRWWPRRWKRAILLHH